MTDEDFYSALGSLLNLKVYIYKFANVLNLKYDVYANSDWGFKHNNPNTIFIDEEILNKNRRIEIDKLALEEFDTLLKSLRKNNTKIYAYFYPRYHLEWHDKVYLEQYNQFNSLISTFFYSDEKVFNFNDEKYAYIYSDKNNYSNGTHLSEQGTNHILKEIERILNAS